MKKRVYGRKLSRERDTRRALFRALIRALVKYDKITTTKAKAKAIQGDVDKLVNLAKDGSIQTQRRLFASLGNDKETTKALVEKIAPVFTERKGGYTRIVNLPRRRGDAAEIVRMEWVKPIPEKEEKIKSKKKSNGKSVASKKKGETTKKIKKTTKTSKKK
ncbi:50S ribosomal protein L17 [Patescibacteria group bacterium]|nr:50S ribosomal protein L17 [Patescibacteria group bacterium]MBU0776819.1 50S ribosomal protein L17 [Patescibacteria group bacterium]MBU0845606.1 50S ribosomal protein L17 [Patescibacteria group bacterium]MBU0922648.1 50S ribosomal protein L17 [Patescibacteria group bacterium]MBU1066699.1 50S ribosomal protein L17 [Patescibacteria group bacterium]